MPTATAECSGASLEGTVSPVLPPCGNALSENLIFTVFLIQPFPLNKEKQNSFLSPFSLACVFNR